jgi:hypothetical protein
MIEGPQDTCMTPSRRPLVPFLLACCCLASGCDKKSGATYTENVVGAMREGKAMDVRGDMQSISLAVTQWIANDGDLTTAPDFASLVTQLEPTWLRVVPRTDPWGTGYKWLTDGSSWKLRSFGRDGVGGNADDIVMQDGQMIQLPKSFTPIGADK